MFGCTNSTWRHLEVQDNLQWQSGAQTKMSSCILDELQDMFQSGELPDYLMRWLNSVCMALFLPWSVSTSCVLFLIFEWFSFYDF